MIALAERPGGGVVEVDTAGHVVSMGEHDDSYFSGHCSYWANVWDGEAKALVRVDNGCCCGTKGLKVDATPEVAAEYHAWFQELEATRRKAVRFDLAESRARELTVGKEVKVVRGRKVAKGTTGYIAKVGVSQYGPGALIEKPDGEKVFVNQDYLEIIDWPDYLDLSLIA